MVVVGVFSGGNGYCVVCVGLSSVVAGGGAIGRKLWSLLTVGQQTEGMIEYLEQ